MIFASTNQDMCFVSPFLFCHDAIEVVIYGKVFLLSN